MTAIINPSVTHRVGRRIALMALIAMSCIASGGPGVLQPVVASPFQSTATLTVGAAGAAAGDNVDITISLAPGSSSISTLQFDLPLAASLSYVSLTPGSAAIAASKNVSGGMVGGSLRVLVFNLNQNLLGSGPVAIVRLAVASGTLPGTISVPISGITASDPLGIAVAMSGINGSVTVLPPPDATPPVISSVASSGISGNGATITWSTNEASDTQIDYGTTASYGSSTTLNSSMATSHAQSITGLSPGTTYNYRVKSRDAAGNLATSGNYTFTTSDTTSPVISNVASTGISGTGATITWTTNEASDTQIEYGASFAYGSSTTLDPSMVTSHSQSMTGLSPGTTYYYRVKSRDAAGNLATSGNYTFRTLDTTGPVISNVASSGISGTGATITWTTNEAGDTQIDYGTTTSYGSSTTLNSGMVTSHSQGLSGLTSGTTYHYRVKSRDAAGNLATSGDYTFTTSDTTAPVISSVASSGISDTGATITWTTNEASDSQVDYGTTTSYGSSTTLNSSMVTSHSQALSGLTSGTTYHYRVKSRDAAGNLTTSGDYSFATTQAPDSSVPVISGVASTSITASGATIVWTTNETCDTQVEYGTTAAYGNLTPLNTGLVTTHTQSLGGLPANTPHHFRVRSRDKAGNLAVSGDYIFSTKAPDGTAPPVISAITIAHLGSGEATITWTTDVRSDTQVLYGKTADCSLATRLNVKLVTSHAQKLTGLSSDTTYYFLVQSRSAAGALAVSDLRTFRTLKSRRSKLVYPHLATTATQPNTLSDTRHTGVAVANLSASDATLTFTAFDRNGMPIAGANIENPVQLTLLAGAQLPIMDSQLFGSGLLDIDAIGWIEVESSIEAVTGFTLIFDSSLSMMDGAAVSDTPLTQFLFTEIDDSGFTMLNIANPNLFQANLRLQLVQSNGVVSATASRTVNANGVLAETLTDLFPGANPTSNDYVRAFSDAGVTPFQLMGKEHQYLKALNGQDLYSGATTLYSPQYVVGGGYQTTLSITNLDKVEGSLVLRLIGDDGSQIGATHMMPIAPEGKVYISDPSFFGISAGEPVQGYVEVISNGPKIVGSVSFGDPEQQAFATSLPLVSQLEDSMVFSQVASDSTYYTGLAMLNPNAEDATATIDLYKADGTLEASMTVIIPAGERISRLLDQLFPEIAGQAKTSGYIRVQSDRGIAGYSVFGTRNLNTLSAVPAQIVR